MIRKQGRAIGIEEMNKKIDRENLRNMIVVSMMYALVIGPLFIMRVFILR